MLSVFCFLPVCSSKTKYNSVQLNTIWYITVSLISLKFQRHFCTDINCCIIKENWNTCCKIHFFCTLSTRRNTVHFNYVLSLVELALSMGWKCTWCFSCNKILNLYLHMRSLFRAFCYIQAIKSCLLPFLSNSYCTSIKRPTSIKWPLLKVPRVAA